MKNINKLIGGLLTILSIGLFTSSCSKEDDQEFNQLRMFTPGRIDIATEETQAVLSWNSSLFTEGKKVQYTVEVAKDSSFQTIEHTVVVDTPKVVITDDNLVLKQKYVARIKANTYNSTPESNWILSKAFSITGEQIFLPVSSTTLKDKSVVLVWRLTQGLSKIVLTSANNQPIEVALTTTDVADAQKQIKGLLPSTEYTAQIFAGTKLKGEVKFTTKEPSAFTTIITPADDLLLAIENAANNDVIGMEPGEYNYTTSNITITGKHITLQSTSGNAGNTKINFKEVVLKGTGAGVKLSGIQFDGTTGSAAYFLNLVGLNSDGEAANFRSILVENCIIRNTANCLIRANRGTNNGDHKIESIKFDNCVASDNGLSTYNYFSINKLEFKSLQLINSTFYNTARAFIGWETNMTVSQMPTVLISQCTINGFGFSTRNNILFDANGNAVDFMMQNSIVANAPKPGQTVGASLLRGGAGSIVKVEFTNLFNLTTGATPAVDLTFPTIVQQSSNTAVNLGWTYTTTNFVLPANSPLRTSGRGGVAVGDPRWH